MIDLRSLSPVDWETIGDVGAKDQPGDRGLRGLAVVGLRRGDRGADRATRCFEWLDAPVRRVASTDTFVAYAPELEDVILPQVEDLREAIGAIARF